MSYFRLYRFSCYIVGAVALMLLPLVLTAQGTVPGEASCGQPGTGILWRHDWLEANRQAIASGDAFLGRRYKWLIGQADDALERGPYSVTQKTTLPPSGDLHDYSSLAPYWWPDPENPGGPYIRRDGEVNPERASDRYDKMRLNAMCEDVQVLALAGYFSGNAAYGNHAAALIDAWFLAPETRMNPNLEYAQGVPGRSDGRGTGIIDTRCLTGVADASLLLRQAGVLEETQLTGLRAWAGEYADWLVESGHGQKERAAGNNHGSWYDVQLGAFGAFAGRDEFLEEAVLRIRDERLPQQVADDGRMPEELGRTQAMHYTLFTLGAFQEAATLARCLGLDLWNSEQGGVNRLRVATDYPTAHFVDGAEWPWQDIHPPEVEEGYRAFMVAWQYWGDARYRNAALHFEGDDEVGLAGLLIPRQRIPAGQSGAR